MYEHRLKASDNRQQIMEGNRELCLEWEAKCLAGAVGAILGVFGRDETNKRDARGLELYLRPWVYKAEELGSCIYF